MIKENFDIVVVGGGHAGLEAALISSFLGCKTAIITMDPQAIARMSCNPAIGGLAKGQIVREIDVLGGVMGKVADASGLQFKTLNKKKGRAVWSPRAQIDKRLYEKIALQKVLKSPISIIKGEATSIQIKNYKIRGFKLRSGETIKCSNGIVTAGTFLSGIIHIGERKILAGRMGEERSEGLTESLSSYGFRTGRLKTGTPPRALKNSILWTKTTKSFGDKNPMPFSYSTKAFNPPNDPCHTINTNEETHSIIKKNLNLSPMFSGDIGGIGPRYCPSIEDKVFKFENRPSHLIHLEPEWKNSDQIYINGFSTSLPEEAQVAALKTIPSLKEVELLRPGYAIEYDFFPPSQLKASLETKDVSGLFFAGQMNGTSGYEEAAAQGLICGVNAANKKKHLPALVLSRSSSYIGVMIDDLITKDTLEPYRMFTSRAEHRLLLRYSNTFERLFLCSKKHKLLTKESLQLFKNITNLKTAIEKKLDTSIDKSTLKNKEDISQKTPAKTILKRPSVSIFDILKNTTQKETTIPKWLEKDIMYDVESDIKYEGYINRHLKEIKQIEKNNQLKIPKKTNYKKMRGLSKEAIEKLSLLRPENLGQAMRIAGITPADISVLNIYLIK